MPLPALLLKPLDDSYMSPPTFLMLAERAALRVAEQFYWAAGPVDVAAIVILAFALLRSEGKKGPLVAGLLFALGGLSFWVWVNFFLHVG